MMQRVSDAAPAALIAVAVTAVAIGLVPGLASIQFVLPHPFSLVWLVFLFLGGVAVTAGICLRRARVTRRVIVGQAMELIGNGLAGGMLLIYALVLIVVYGLLSPSWLTIWLMLALSSAFLGPWCVIVRDLYRAWLADRE